MDIIIKLNNQTAGRDKIIRLMQYGSRAYWYYAQNKNGTVHSVNLLKSLEYTFSSFRKLLRLGRFVDSLYSALQTMKYPDLIVRVTLTMSKIAYSLYLLADHIIWCGRAGIFKINLDKWTTFANRYWLMTIILNLTRDLHEITHILETRSRNYYLSSAHFTKYDRIHKHLENYRQHEDVILDTLKNGCDLFIPLTALGFTRLSPGAVGLLGLVSSAVGIYSLIRPETKLVPS